MSEIDWSSLNEIPFRPKKQKESVSVTGTAVKKQVKPQSPETKIKKPAQQISFGVFGKRQSLDVVQQSFLEVRKPVQLRAENISNLGIYPQKVAPPVIELSHKPRRRSIPITSLAYSNQDLLLVPETPQPKPPVVPSKPKLLSLTDKLRLGLDEETRMQRRINFLLSEEQRLLDKIQTSRVKADFLQKQQATQLEEQMRRFDLQEKLEMENLEKEAVREWHFQVDSDRRAKIGQDKQDYKLKLAQIARREREDNREQIKLNDLANIVKVQANVHSGRKKEFQMIEQKMLRMEEFQRQAKVYKAQEQVAVRDRVAEQEQRTLALQEKEKALQNKINNDLKVLEMEIEDELAELQPVLHTEKLKPVHPKNRV